MFSDSIVIVKGNFGEGQERKKRKLPGYHYKKNYINVYLKGGSFK